MVIIIIQWYPITVPDLIYKEEMWFPLSTNFIPEIVPNVYSVSTWGRLYSAITGKYYPNENSTSESYINVYLSMQDGSVKTYYLHRIIAMVFVELMGMKILLLIIKMNYFAI